MRINVALFAPLAVVLALGVAFYVSLQRGGDDALPSMFVGRPAPAIDMEPLGDFPLATTEDLNVEGWKLVNFWASWCPPCRAEHPQLMALAEEGWTILGINKSDRPENALGFLRELGDPFAKHAADPNGRQALEWGVYGLPETFLIDPDGQIRYRHAGPITRRVWSDNFAKIVDELQNADTN